MIINSFGLLKNKKIIIFNYSYEREFLRKDVRAIKIESYRKFHVNILAFLLALCVLIFLEYRGICPSLICLSLLVFSIFFKKISYRCIIFNKKSITSIKICKKELNDARFLVDKFNSFH